MLMLCEWTVPFDFLRLLELSRQLLLIMYICTPLNKVLVIHTIMLKWMQVATKKNVSISPLK